MRFILKALSTTSTYLLLTSCSIAGASTQEVCSLLNQQQATAHRAENTRHIANTLEQNMAAAEASLSDNRAYQGGECVEVEERPLPTKPEVLSEDAIMFQAFGSAVDLAMRRFNSQEVTEALLAVRLDDLLQVYAEWKQGPKEQCALIVPPQMDNWICNTIFRIPGREAVNSCIQDVVKGYAAQAMQACRAPLAEWEAEVAAIQSEPENLLSSCQRDLKVIADAEKRLPQLHMEEAINREESQKLAGQLSAMRPVSPGACQPMQ